MSVIVYKSTDTNAPLLFGLPVQLISLLQAVLVDGYGGAVATGTITTNGTNVSDGDTVTVGSQTYTFKTTLTGAANEIHIGASAATSLINLSAAIHGLGTPNTDYTSATQVNADAWAPSVSSTVITLNARAGGLAGNSIALAKSAATLTVSGSTFSGGTSGAATGTLTSDNTNVANNETVTIGSTVYTFKTTLTGAAFEILIGASADTSLNNLRDAIGLGSGNGSGGGAGSEYGTGTTAHPSVTCSSVSSHTITVTSNKPGIESNSIATTETSAHLSWGASTLTGGVGHQGAGWTKPYVGSNGQAVFRPGSGVQHYFHVDDATPGGFTQKEAQFRGSEGASGFQSGITNYFPTTGQIALGSGVTIRKSTSLDGVARTWTIIADDRTAYLFVLTGDSSNVYYTAAFGEFYSIYSGTDLYRSFVIGRNATNSTAAGNERLCDILNDLGTHTSHYAARSYTAVGGSILFGKFGDWVRGRGGSNAGTNEMMSSALPGMAVPNGPDGNLHIAPVHVCETGWVRGRMRGFYHLCHPQSSFADGDTITGSGAYAGRTFLVIKQGQGVQGNVGGYCLEITGPWETN